MSSDQDLKLGDTLRYYQRDSHAAKALLVRRLRCLSAYETANRNLERARVKNKDVHGVSSPSIFVNFVQFCCTLCCTILINENEFILQPLEVQEVHIVSSIHRHHHFFVFKFFFLLIFLPLKIL